MMRSFFLFAATAAGAAMMLGASFSHAEDRISIKINIVDMKFHIDGAPENTPLILKAGQDYRLVLENMGQMKHEVLFGREVQTKDNEEEFKTRLFDGFPVTFSGAVMIKNEKRVWEIEANGLNEVELDPETRVVLYFNLPEKVRGHWEMGCFMPGHYMAGMRLPLRVE